VKNEWAVVTGASSGIGKALALELASRGYDVFLTGRNQEALRRAADECERYGVRTQLHAADLADAAQTDALVHALGAAGFPCSFLVNNAGFGVKGAFSETDLASELDMVHVQLDAALKLTKSVLPGMLARRTGCILNVASVYSFTPVARQSVYGACKGFLLSFSAALREEIRGSGVKVSVLCAGVTRTEFRLRAGIKEKNPNAGISAEDLARIAVDKTLAGRAIIVTGFPNWLFTTLGRHLPFWIVPPIVNFINNRRGVNR
jgi:short-subunit dehydrogenase